MTDRLRLSLPPNAHAPGIARSFVHEQAAQLPRHVANDAELLVSELVSNAVLHGSPQITVSVEVDPPCIGVAVRDEGDAVPTTEVQPPPATRPTGRGLLIVDLLADSWGVTPTDPPPGKTVWCAVGAADC